jgi:hypothetical protein
MKKSFASIACAIALSCFFCHLAWAQETKKPNLVIKETLFDAGEIDEGKVIEHTFSVHNSGDATLEIKNVRPG